MQRVLLIDGYNVILGDESLRATFGEDQEGGRRRLLEAVSRFATVNSVRAVVVFDGGSTEEGRVDVPSPAGVETIFVKDADRYIRARVSGRGGGEGVTVVSSDEQHVAAFARRMGARVMGVAAFMAKLRGLDRGGGTGGEKPREETKAGVEYWLGRFRSGEREEG